MRTQKGKREKGRGKQKLVIFFFVILALVSLPSSLFPSPSSQVEPSRSEYELGLISKDFMLRKYSKLEDQTVLNRVGNIWNKVSRVVDRRSGVRYRIDILDTDEVGAWAFPGGFVVMTKGLINIAATDDELAFVVAHELGHQSRGHVDKPMEPELEEKYREIIAQQGIDGQGFVNEFVNEITKQKEVEADHFGVLYTSLAGYDVSSASSILDKVITSDKTRTHPSKEARQQKIQERLQGIIDKLEVFEAGLIFFHLEKYDYAEAAFLNFLAVYPSREVYNNLGITYHQKALTYYTPERDIPTKKNMQIDLETRARHIKVTPKSLKGPAKEDFERVLSEAIETYKRAIEQDPDYVMSYNNLGCACDDLGEFDFAVSWLKKAIKIRSDYKEAHNNLGVAYIHSGEFEEAIASLKKAIQLDASYADTYFNLAMAYEAFGESKEVVAENLTLFLKHNPDKKSDLLKIASEKLGLEAQTIVSEINPPAVARRRVTRGILETKLGASTRILDIIPSEKVSMYLYPDKGTKLITYGLRGSVVCIIADNRLAGSTPEDIRVGHTREQLIKTYGEPQRVSEIGGLQYYSYPEKGLLFSLGDNEVKSWMIWFETN